MMLKSQHKRPWQRLCGPSTIERSSGDTPRHSIFWARPLMRRGASYSTDVHPNLLVENPTQEFERAAQRRAEAEKALAEWSAKQRIMRAQHSKHRPCYLLSPGEPRMPTKAGVNLGVSTEGFWDRRGSLQQSHAKMQMINHVLGAQCGL